MSILLCLVIVRHLNQLLCYSALEWIIILSISDAMLKFTLFFNRNDLNWHVIKHFRQGQFITWYDLLHVIAAALI